MYPMNPFNLSSWYRSFFLEAQRAKDSYIANELKTLAQHARDIGIANKLNDLTQRARERDIAEQYVQRLPIIPDHSKVLVVDADVGFIPRCIKDTIKCDVFALESNPSYFNSCVEKLGKDHVEQLTLQEAL